MTAILLISIIAVAFSLLIISLSLVLGESSDIDQEKASPFECGFDPLRNARLPFSMRFFLLAIIFLIFDVEIVLLFPLLIKLSFNFDLFCTLSASGFFLILLLGLIHEWRENSLD